MSMPLLVVKRLGPRAIFTQASRSLSLTPQKSAGYWNKDWRPAEKLPETEEERRAAAKKYGLIPEDYEPYPDDGSGVGDYPNLPLVAAESKDPHGNYDFPELKRNFGEPMPVDFDMVGEDRWNINYRHPVPLWMQACMFVGTMTALWIFSCAGEYLKIVPVRMMPKQYAYAADGKTHYSYELEDVE